MFYQSQHSLNADIFKIEEGFDFSFPSHLHNSFELVAVTEGSMCVTVDGTVYTLSRGDACLIFPNQIHSMSTPVHSRHFLCIFSPKYTQAYTKSVYSTIPSSSLFSPDEFYLNKLYSLRAGGASLIDAKGVLYSLCAEFHRTALYHERKPDKNKLLFDVFRYVEENYSAECTLASLSSAMSRHYVYLSKYFKQCMGISFTEYVTAYRINEACYLLRTSESAILEIALECGFDSLRSFNRNFKSTLGITPSEYRERINSIA